jgi:hypothetical protein
MFPAALPNEVPGDLEQIGMSTGTIKNDFLGCRVYFVDEQPIVLDMTFAGTFVFPIQGMILIFWRQRLFSNNKVNNFPQSTHIFTAALHQLGIFFELPGLDWSKHILQIQVFPEFINRTVTFGGNFASFYGISLRNGGDGLGVVPQFPGFGISVPGAKGARLTGGKRGFSFSNIFGAWINGGRKGKHNPALRYFARHGKGQPMAGRYFNGLRNAHEVSLPQTCAKGKIFSYSHGYYPRTGGCLSGHLIVYRYPPGGVFEL